MGGGWSSSVSYTHLPILGTLGYVVAGEHVLLVHRGRKGDVHAGKWNGLGGKLEADEDVYSCLCRELREEAGIEVTRARLRGTVSWPGFGIAGEAVSYTHLDVYKRQMMR